MECWASILKNHFPKKSWKKHYQKIIFFISSVNNGVKPSLLWDFGGCVTVEILSAFLNDLKILNMISKDVILIKVENDFLITNLNLALDRLNKNRLFIDVSKKLSEPVIIEENESVRKMITSLKAKLENFKRNEKFLDIEINNLCVPTLFGVLLDYPIIYFYESSSLNALFRLKVFEVFCRPKNGAERIAIYSFSIPESLCDPVVDIRVASWFDSLRIVNQSFFSDLSLESKIENVNCFIL